MVDFGLKHVVFDNITKAISKKKSYQTHEQIDALIEGLKQQLDQERYVFHKMLDATSTCEHDFDEGVHYDVKMVMGNFIRHFERKCKKCGCIDSVNNNGAAMLTLPPWINKTKARYYNNDI